MSQVHRVDSEAAILVGVRPRTRLPLGRGASSAALLALFCVLVLAPRLAAESKPARRVTTLPNVDFGEYDRGPLVSGIRPRGMLLAGWLLRPLAPGDWDPAALTAEIRELEGRQIPRRSNWFGVSMPAQVQEELRRLGRIPRLFSPPDYARAAWVFSRDWGYATMFLTPPAETEGPVFLRCAGLDTLVTVYLNGQEVAQCNDMFRRHAFNIRPWLKEARKPNVLLLVVRSPRRFLQKVREECGDEIPPENRLRKCAWDLYGDYGDGKPYFPKLGVFRDVILDVPGRAWLEDVCVRTTLSSDFATATVRVQVESAGQEAELRWSLSDPAGRQVVSGRTDTRAGVFQFDVPRPKLWWPHTHGTPHLYTLGVEVFQDGRLEDARQLAVGFREVEAVLRDPATSENRFAFKINGRLIYLRGACWWPLDFMTHVWDEQKAERLLDLATHANMNLLRVSGEGIIPPPHFYDECDRRGILVWQEFMTGHGLRFPLDEPEYRETIVAEAVDEIKLLRNHPCILLWCGGNEHYVQPPSQEEGVDETSGGELLEVILPQLVAEHDPTRHYHPSSPYGGSGSRNDPREGDWHDDALSRFHPGGTVPLFASEVCHFDPPYPRATKASQWVDRYWSARSVLHFDDFRPPPNHDVSSFSRHTPPRVLGTAHGAYLRRTIERFRRGVPNGRPDGSRRCWGSVVWRLNDPWWPQSHFCIINCTPEPTIAYYALRRAYAPVLVSFEKTDNRVHVWIVNDSADPVSGRLTVERMDFHGRVGQETSVDVEVQPGEAKRCLDTDSLGSLSRFQELYVATFGEQVSSCFLAEERYLELPKARLTVQAVADGLRIHSPVLAKQVSLRIKDKSGVVFEDNYFDLFPGQTRTVRLQRGAGGGRLRIEALDFQPVEVEWEEIGEPRTLPQ